MKMLRTVRILSALLQILGPRGSMVLHVGGRAGRAEVNCDSTKSAGFRRILRLILPFLTQTQRPQSVRPDPMERYAIGASGHWTGERDPLYRHDMRMQSWRRPL